MPPIPPRLREAVAIVLLAFGVVSTLFNAVTFLFSPNGCIGTGIGAMKCTGSQGGTYPFSYRALGATGALLDPLVTVVLAGAVALVHIQPRPRTGKALAMAALITTALAGLLGMIALFASFGADAAPGFMKATNFFIGLTELAVAGAMGWLILTFYRQYGPSVRYGQPPYGPQLPTQWNQAPQQQWNQPPPPQQQQPGAPGGQWGPAPQQPWGPQ